MNDKEKKIKKAVETTNHWLAERQRKHVSMVEKSIKELQDNIINTVHKLSLADKKSRVEGLRVNLKQAQKIHVDIEKMFEGKFNKATKRIIDDFKPVSRLIERSYQYLDTPVNFSGIDIKAMEVLRDGYWREYLDIGSKAKNQIIQSVYSNVLANGEFVSLVASIEGSLLGSNAVSATGRPLAQYARLYARDMLMNYHNEVNILKAKDAKLTHFLYIGNIVETTRDFCKKRAGKYYSRKQIMAWRYKWVGKSGPALTHRGGYNCRHHWQPINPKWLKGKKKINVQDFNLE